MIKDKVIEMDNKKNYYVLESVEYNDKKYILTVECDLLNDDIKEENYFVMEFFMEKEELKIRPIEDDKIATVVTTMLLNKVRNN